MSFLESDQTVPIPVRRNRWIAVLAVIVVLAVGLRWLTRPRAPAPPTEVELDPRATFLRAADGARDPRIFPLGELGLRPGDSVALVRADSGDRSRATVLALFSETDSLAPPDRRYRVPGALGTGRKRVTGPGPGGGPPTDIPQDFGVGGEDPDSVALRVPSLARYLFLAVEVDTVADSAVTVRVVPGTGRGLVR